MLVGSLSPPKSAGPSVGTLQLMSNTLLKLTTILGFKSHLYLRNPDAYATAFFAIAIRNTNVSERASATGSMSRIGCLSMLKLTPPESGSRTVAIVLSNANSVLNIAPNATIGGDQNGQHGV